MKKLNYRLGIDIGASSAGWSVTLLDKKNNPVKPYAIGSRVFSDGRNVQDRKTTLKAMRGAARGARRNRDRFVQRRTFLVDYLTEIGLLPENKNERNKLKNLNPLQLRAESLERKLKPYELGRALYHLNQRRGFKSNRKDKNEDIRDGSVNKSITMLLSEMGLVSFTPPTKEELAKMSKEEKKECIAQQDAEQRTSIQRLSELGNVTFGKFLYGRFSEGKPTRARRFVDSKLYDVYPVRALVEDEFQKIITKQKSYHSQILTDAVVEKLHGIIFSQRPLKPQKVGMCTYIKGEKRMYRALPCFQTYRILQDVHNLELLYSNGEIHRVVDHQGIAHEIKKVLEHRKSATFKALRKVVVEAIKGWKIESLPKTDFTFNYETENRKYLLGNSTSVLLADESRVGSDWYNWHIDKQDDLVSTLLGIDETSEDKILDDKTVIQNLMDKFDLTYDQAFNCVEAEVDLEEGVASLSHRACGYLIGSMMYGSEKEPTMLLTQVEAVQDVAKNVEDFTGYGTRSSEELLDKLPYYGELFQDGRHIIPGSRIEKYRGKNDFEYWGGVSNPTVHIALNELRKIVNELIDRFGKPASINIELARDLPYGERQLDEENKRNRQNKKLNDTLNGELDKLGIRKTANNRLLLRLWNELGPDYVCPFSGHSISIEDVFNGRTHTEHLIPYSVSLDDSFSNKVLCTQQANADKGNRTPYAAFGNSPSGYNWKEISNRITNLPESKRAKFRKDVVIDDQFLMRHLNDTRYIGKLAREYLSAICLSHKIDVSTGNLTNMIRNHFGLNKILHDNAWKNRDDHRHHAIDAVVLGMIDSETIKRVSSVAKKYGEVNSYDVARILRNGRDEIIDADTLFCDTQRLVSKMIVSHKVSHKLNALLHRETAYGIVDMKDVLKKEKEMNGRLPLPRVRVRHTKPVETFGTLKRIQMIADTEIRNALEKEFVDKGVEGVVEYCKKRNIKNIRYNTVTSVIPVRDKEGKIYKAFEGNGYWALEIYELPNGKWAGVPISRFEANNPDYKIGHSSKPHPAAKLKMRIFRNDCLKFEEGGKVKVVRVQKMSGDTSSIFTCNHFEANVDKRNRDADSEFKYRQFSPNQLMKLGVSKIGVSPTGLSEVGDNCCFLTTELRKYPQKLDKAA